MEIRKIRVLYFSATGNTERAATTIAEELAKKLNVPMESIAFTRPAEREREYYFTEEELVLVASPTYAGKLPNKILPDFRNKLHGNGTMVVPVVLFGNRNYDDALIELRNLLQLRHFSCVAGAAFVGEHSFSTVLAAGRPDDEDRKLMDGFGETVAGKVLNLDFVPPEKLPIAVSGCDPIRPYYKPRDREGNFINILKVKPVTDAEKCTNCGLCAAKCPMGSISADNVAEVAGICIKCCACVKGCPTGAKYFTDEGYLYHQHELEEMYARRAEVTMFL